MPKITNVAANENERNKRYEIECKSNMFIFLCIIISRCLPNMALYAITDLADIRDLWELREYRFLVTENKIIKQIYLAKYNRSYNKYNNQRRVFQKKKYCMCSFDNILKMCKYEA